MTARKLTANILVTITVLGVFAAGAYSLHTISTNRGSAAQSSIKTFEDCAEAGNPILESYPERCVTPDGATFTKQY